MFKIVISLLATVVCAILSIASVIVLPFSWPFNFIVTLGFIISASLWTSVSVINIREYRAEKRRVAFTNLLSACKQNGYVFPSFNEKNFPPKPVASDESEYEVYEYHFDKTVNGLNAFKKLEELDYRLCDPRQAMEWIANGHLDVQLDHPLIVTARRQYSRGGWCAPLFDRNCDGRSLFLCGLDGGFDPDCGWLVLRKKNS